MKAKDTVLGTTQDAVWDFEKFKLDQATVSFKAGRGEGRREVAEWVEKQWRNWPYSAFLLDEYSWQAQLKEWGVE